MLLLALETATERASVAVLEGERLLAAESPPGAPTRSDALLPAIDRTMREAGVKVADLGGYAVAIGPGSFTGLRVGIATVKGLALPGGEPVAAVPTLAAMARQAGEPRPYPVVAVLDARRGEIYAAAYPAGPGFEPLVAEGLYGPGELAARLPPDARMLGDVDAFRAGIGFDGAGGPPARPLAETDGASLAMHVGVIGGRALAAGRGVGAAALVPRYLRRAEAEVRRTGERVEGPV